ncbi:DNA-directed RNA polymerases IV and V subunit 4-like isoform X2 [Mercurialis annua]|uniref:DNA-directed RNA polymerases IV and V subunit 4-like isoform X2 n=1 Tax=Mercurialis annua TaxID=3986 RepID=UPI00215DDB7C|nr:DNA-directed RNA polymerases IV and V subunit 4-like isoform X2 [Mercurialis annua]
MEKGGKGFSLPGTALKSSLKSPPPPNSNHAAKGKEDGSGKSNRGRTVQFNSEGLDDDFDFLSNSNGNVNSAAAKGNMSKGGKGDKTSNGGKASSKKDRQTLELKIEQELPKNSTCLMDCEAAQILQGIQEQMVLLSQDATIKLPVSFDRALPHAKKGSHYTNPQSVRRILDGLKKHGVSDGEIAVIANVCPESTDEVFALVRSLKSKMNELTEPLTHVLGQLAELKKQA